LVGSMPLPDAETVFRTVSGALGQHLIRIPDGETGIRKTWIKFLQDVLAENPAIEVAKDVPPFKFVQWDGKLIREIARLRLKPGARPDPASFKTGYGEMAIQSWHLFSRLQREGAIPAGVKFQVSLPTPIAPVYNNLIPADRPTSIWCSRRIRGSWSRSSTGSVRGWHGRSSSFTCRCQNRVPTTPFLLH